MSRDNQKSEQQKLVILSECWKAFQTLTILTEEPFNVLGRNEPTRLTLGDEAQHTRP